MLKEGNITIPGQLLVLGIDSAVRLHAGLVAQVPDDRMDQGD